MIWNPPQGRISALKKAWKAGENKWHLLFMFFGSIPIFLYPKGEQAYYRSAEKFGDECWYAPHNLWREVFHFAAGFGCMAIFSLNLWTMITGFMFITLAAVLNEILSDIPESGIHAKNFMDVYFWVLGSFLFFWIWLH